VAIQKETLNQSLLALFSDKEIADKLAASGSPEACYGIVKTHLPDISFEDFTKDSERINEYINENKGGLLELNELDEVAGGLSLGIVAVAVGVGAVAIAT